MTNSARHATRPEALDERGRLLVFAPPLLLGFIGSPLALATVRGQDEQSDRIARRNWAKRRAY